MLRGLPHIAVPRDPTEILRGSKRRDDRRTLFQLRPKARLASTNWHKSCFQIRGISAGFLECRHLRSPQIPPRLTSRKVLVQIYVRDTVPRFEEKSNPLQEINLSGTGGLKLKGLAEMTEIIPSSPIPRSSPGPGILEYFSFFSAESPPVTR
jgi:hypothetical protein